jgi:DNA-directed RNA polymerase subunit RPC12/RpoP
MKEDDFTSFQCGHCHTEIEASPDLIGQETECPACGTRLTVPDNRMMAQTVSAVGLFVCLF